VIASIEDPDVIERMQRGGKNRQVMAEVIADNLKKD
jgi:hypothetical protein